MLLFQAQLDVKCSKNLVNLYTWHKLGKCIYRQVCVEQLYMNKITDPMFLNCYVFC